MAASNAVACANMALAGYDPVIPLDEVIRTMDDVGKSIPSEFRLLDFNFTVFSPLKKNQKNPR
jgi:L-serine deaminase